MSALFSVGFYEGARWALVSGPTPWGGKSFGGWGSQNQVLDRLQKEPGARRIPNGIEYQAYTSADPGLSDLVARVEFQDQGDLFSDPLSCHALGGADE